jgi:nitroimidazol reductase NimA-like FMN-containing flavoprotein (pyridoxamine 5'-phosphate oxidase superfamily)
MEAESRPAVEQEPEPGPAAELPLAECRRRLRAAKVGRVAWSAPDGPHVLPVSSLYRNGGIVFRTSPTGVLAALRSRSNVAFEIDEIGPDEAWSVVLRGMTHEIRQSDDLIELWEDEGLVPWAAGKRPVFIEIEPRTISGRQYLAPGG